MKKKYKADITWETNQNEFLLKNLSFEELVELDCQKFPAIHHPELNNKPFIFSGLVNKRYRKHLIKELKLKKKQII
ncbi:MAG: hypothetical protein IK085_01695 [Clostridia bacterium]|nr:hypothetical protein [Clostridia bacterium]